MNTKYLKRFLWVLLGYLLAAMVFYIIHHGPTGQMKEFFDIITFK